MKTTDHDAMKNGWHAPMALPQKDSAVAESMGRFGEGLSSVGSNYSSAMSSIPSGSVPQSETNQAITMDQMVPSESARLAGRKKQPVVSNSLSGLRI